MCIFGLSAQFLPRFFFGTTSFFKVIFFPLLREPGGWQDTWNGWTPGPLRGQGKGKGYDSNPWGGKGKGKGGKGKGKGGKGKGNEFGDTSQATFLKHSPPELMEGSFDFPGNGTHLYEYNVFVDWEFDTQTYRNTASVCTQVEEISPYDEEFFQGV